MDLREMNAVAKAKNAMAAVAEAVRHEGDLRIEVGSMAWPWVMRRLGRSTNSSSCFWIEGEGEDRRRVDLVKQVWLKNPWGVVLVLPEATEAP